MEKILFISPSTLDKKSLISTIVVCVLPTLIFGWLFATNNAPLKIIMGICFAIFLCASVAGFICTPYKYILTNSELIIKRYFKDIVIPLRNIQLIRLMTPDDKKGMIRTFGADACFGSWGYYRTAKHKKLNIFTRRYNNWTLIVTDQKKYVIAPNDPQLIDAVVQQIGKTEAEMQSSNSAPTNQWHKFVMIAIIALVAFSLFIGYKEPRIVFDSEAFKLKGVYGVNIPFTQIAQADTIEWREMPAISIRTNGISLFKVNRGHFRTTDGDKVRLSVNRGISPVIRIIDRNGAVYFINRKNAAETRQIFNELQKR